MKKINNQILKSITLKNFLSYKNTHIDFHPGVNVIIGAGDTGKSNIRRGLEWVFNNISLQNNGFPLYWEGDPDVKINIGDKLVSRYRSKTENLYTLTHANKKKDIFKSFGKNVPLLIKDYLNLSDLNMSDQWNSFFLLDKSAADVARHYNSLVNLEVIDKTISNIASTLRKEKGELKIQEIIYEKKTEELKTYDWLKDAEKDLSKLEKLKNYLKHLNSEWSELAGLIQQLEKLEKLNQKLQIITKYEKTVNDLETKSIKIKVQKQKQIELSTLIANIESFTNQNKKLKKIIQYQANTDTLIGLLNQINKNIDGEGTLAKYVDQLKQHQENQKRCTDIIKFAPEMKALLVLNDVIEKGVSKHDFLIDLIENRLKLDKEASEWKNKQQILENEFTELMPDQCPLCGK